MTEASPSVTAERRSPTPAAARKREAIRRLQEALKEDRIVLHYQPVVAASDLRVAALEALLRWRDGAPDTVDLSPLLLQAERSPVIYRVENWTLSLALRTARAWPEGARLNVNLSAREFPRADLVKRLRGRLKAARLPPERLALELTETSSLHEFEHVAREMRELADMGIELWLDDFGTGHSSLEWLSHLPCHGLKIAGTFVERLFTEPRCQAILEGVMAMAHDLGLRVIGEGVERPDQRDFLAARGCDFFQGFLYHPALPAERVGDLLAAPSRS